MASFYRPLRRSEADGLQNNIEARRAEAVSMTLPAGRQVLPYLI